MKHRKNSHVWPIYGSGEKNLFTCEVYHGLAIYMDHRKIRYIGGKKDYFDYLDPDELSLIELATMVEELGYSKETPIWCRARGEKNINPKLLESDQELTTMVNQMKKKKRVLECMLDHNENHGFNAIQNETLHSRNVVVIEDKVDYIIDSSQVHSDGIGKDSDFYDPDNDFGADDDDIRFELNVTPGIESDLVVPQHIETELGELEDSDYAPSDELLSEGESDDEMESKRRYPEFNSTIDMANPYFEVGMVFGSFNEYKKVVIEYVIKERRNIRFEKNDTKRVRVVCKKDCPWMIWVSRLRDGTENIQVKTFNSSHTCVNEHNLKFLTVKWLVKKYLQTFRADPTWSLAGIIDRVRNGLYLKITRQKAWKVKSSALKILAGNEEEQYAKLPDYAHELKKINLGSSVIYDLRLQIFKRAYVCLTACRDGFLAGYRPIISLDSCWLKGRYGGWLLAAVAIDANDDIFPIAYAIVEGENSESWRWFMQLLVVDIGFVNSNVWTFMSDRQKGLVPILNTLFPRADHRFCVCHMYQNYFSAGHKGKTLKKHLWMAAMATHEADHKKRMSELKELSQSAYTRLANKPANEWSKSQFSTWSKSDMLLNNLSECFNKYILDARDKPILTMLEIIRTKLMQRLQVKRDEMKKYKGPICPKIQIKLNKWKDESVKYTAIWNGGTHYQVMGFDGQFVVNITVAFCSCRKWDLTGIPCQHACASMRVNGLVPENYIHDFYKVKTFFRIYNHVITPIHGQELWEKCSFKI